MKLPAEKRRRLAGRPILSVCSVCGLLTADHEMEELAQCAAVLARTRPAG